MLTCAQFKLECLHNYAKILESFRVTIKAFHGGHLNGMSCRRLMVSIDGIMDSVAVVSHNRRDERQNDENSFSPCSRAKLEMKLKLYRETFQVLDAAFAGLRTIAPTRGELFGTKKAVKTLAWYWLELNLPETPKWHTFQDHSISDMLKFKGLGDKNDEWIEKWHQVMIKQRFLTNRMTGGYVRQSKTQIRNLWRDKHPKTRVTLEEGWENSSRGAYNVDDTYAVIRERRWQTVERLYEEKIGVPISRRRE